MKLKNNQFGDTIVEVLIAITIVGAVLGGAYIASNKSLQANLASQERVEALKVVESQLESIRATKPSANNFCVSSAGAVIPFTAPYPDSDINLDNLTNYPNNCKFGPSGTAKYYVYITKDATNLYTVQSRWLRVGGGNEEIRMYYRTN